MGACGFDKREEFPSSRRIRPWASHAVGVKGAGDSAPFSPATAPKRPNVPRFSHERGENPADHGSHPICSRYGRSVSEHRPDEVDLLIHAWSERLPGVDVTPLEVMSRLRRVSLRLARIRAGAFATAGLTSWEFDVLAALRRSDEPHELSPAQLIQRTMISSAAMTNRITHLVESGYVERQSNPRDGRGVLVRLTDEGRVRVDAAMTELIRREALALSVLSPEDVDGLARVLRPLMG